MADIFKNTDTKIVTYISVVPKLAIFTIFIKILPAIISFESTVLLILCSLITIIFGSIYGLKALNIKQIMASSCYINAGYMLILLALYTKLSLSCLMFYWLSYIFTNIGVFAGIISLENSNYSNKNDYFIGYFYKNKLFSTCFLINIISLLGIPLTSGFVAKVYLLTSVFNSGMGLCPVVLLLFFVMTLSAVFYLRIVENMFKINPNNDIIHTYKANKIILYMCTIITVFIGILPMYFVQICNFIYY